MTKKNTLSVAELAGLTDTDEKIILIYCDEGLIFPSLEENAPLFADEDVERVLMIRRLTEDLGVNLAGVEVILNMRQQMLHMQSDFERMIDDMRAGILKGLSDYEARIKRPLIESKSLKKIKVK
ncbi:MAG: chaperone modulator CbpM [bacterium]|nr:chaperone modulator CbpM [bacterium]